MIVLYVNYADIERVLFGYFEKVQMFDKLQAIFDHKVSLVHFYFHYSIYPSVYAMVPYAMIQHYHSSQVPHVKWNDWSFLLSHCPIFLNDAF